MEKLKDFFTEIYEVLKPLLMLFLLIGAISFTFFGFTFFAINVEESNLAEIRYCPSCGIDLINK